MRSIIPILLLISTHLHAQLNGPDHYCGRWEFIPEDILLYPGLSSKKREPICKELDIARIGGSKNEYYVWMTLNRGFTFRLLNDTTLFSLFNGDTTLLYYHGITKTLQFSVKNAFVGATMLYLPHFKKVTSRDQVAQLRNEPETFFDYDINKYESLRQLMDLRKGDLYPFPFSISKSFVAQRKIRQLNIQFTALENGKPKTVIYTLNFDRTGKVTKIKKEPGEINTVKNQQRYDAEGWPVDENGMRMINDIYEWEMADKYRPASLRQKGSILYLLYTYEGKQVSKVDVYGDHLKKRLTFQYEYKDGIPTSINVHLAK